MRIEYPPVQTSDDDDDDEEDDDDNDSWDDDIVVPMHMRDPKEPKQAPEPKLPRATFKPADKFGGINPDELPEELQNPVIKGELRRSPTFRSLPPEQATEFTFAAVEKTWKDPYANPGFVPEHVDLENEMFSDGKPFGISKDQRIIMCDLLESGVGLIAAMNAAGIYAATMTYWRKRGGDHRLNGHWPPEEVVEPYASFVRDIFAAEISAEVGSLAMIRGSKDWRAHAWFLERRYRKAWGSNQAAASSVALGVSGNAQIVISIPHNGRDNLDALQGKSPEVEGEGPSTKALDEQAFTSDVGDYDE